MTRAFSSQTPLSLSFPRLSQGQPSNFPTPQMDCRERYFSKAHILLHHIPLPLPKKERESNVSKQLTFSLITTTTTMQDFQSSMPPLPGRIFSATSSAIGSGPSSSGSRRMSSYPHQLQVQTPIKCPRCDSSNTKFCYYNNYNLSQPRHFCKSCRRYWTKGGVLRNVPVGGGCRKNSSKRCKTKPDKFAQTRQQQEQEPESTTTLTVAGSGSGSSSDSSSLNPNPEPIFSETDGSLTGLMAAAGVSGFGFPDPGFQTNNPEQAGLAGLDWPGAVEDPTTSIFDPAMYWGDADPSSLYLP